MRRVSTCSRPGPAGCRGRCGRTSARGLPRGRARRARRPPLDGASGFSTKVCLPARRRCAGEIEVREHRRRDDDRVDLRVSSSTSSNSASCPPRRDSGGRSGAAAPRRGRRSRPPRRRASPPGRAADSAPSSRARRRRTRTSRWRRTGPSGVAGRSRHLRNAPWQASATAAPRRRELREHRQRELLLAHASAPSPARGRPAAGQRGLAVHAPASSGRRCRIPPSPRRRRRASRCRHPDREQVVDALPSRVFQSARNRRGSPAR